MRWFSLALGAVLLAGTVWGVVIALAQHDPSRRVAAVKSVLLCAAAACINLDLGIQPPSDIMSKVYAVPCLLLGGWLLWYLRPPSRTFERYRGERLYPSLLQAWAVAVGSLAVALIVNGVLLLLQWIFPDLDLFVAQVIVIGVAGLVFTAAVAIGILLAIGMQDDAAMETWRQGPRQL